MFAKIFLDKVEQAQITQNDLAKRGGFSRTQFSDLINGLHRPKMNDERIIKIGEFLGLKPDECFLFDPYLMCSLHIKDVSNSRRYPSGLDLLPRSRDKKKGEARRQIFTRDPDYLLCRGAAVGLCNDGLVRHVLPENYEKRSQRFTGFMLTNQYPNRSVVVIEGAYMLQVIGLKGNDKGKPVYAVGPNQFSMDQSKGLKIGYVDFVQPDQRNQASVAFQSSNQ